MISATHSVNTPLSVNKSITKNSDTPVNDSPTTFLPFTLLKIGQMHWQFSLYFRNFWYAPWYNYKFLTFSPFYSLFSLFLLFLHYTLYCPSCSSSLSSIPPLHFISTPFPLSCMKLSPLYAHNPKGSDLPAVILLAKFILFFATSIAERERMGLYSQKLGTGNWSGRRMKWVLSCELWCLEWTPLPRSKMKQNCWWMWHI